MMLTNNISRLGIRLNTLSSLSSSSLTQRYFSTNNNVKDNIKIKVKEEGELGTFEYRVRFFDQNNNQQISPWHQIPMYHDASKSHFNFINEMPKNSNHKMEVNTKELYNPIKQDIKKGQLRYIKHGNLLFNYGCIPQTWENPNINDTLTGMPGDNDPIDVVEIGSKILERGAITPVKVLGALALIDEGETDWKVIAININDENSKNINNLKELEEILPGTVEMIRHWYKVYKVAEGKGENEYALNAQPIDHQKTIQVITETHHAWTQLIKNDPLFTLK